MLAAHRTQKMQRPRLKVHGVWAFGYALRIAVLDETTFHGSSMVIEMLHIALEDVMRVCDQQNRPRPDTLIIVGDNTTKELKNTFCLSTLCNYVHHKRFRSLTFPFIYSNFDSFMGTCGFSFLILYVKF